MMELQGAIGLAQLRKLPDVIKAQRKNRDLIWNAISDIPGITAREMPNGSYDTADALVFFVKDSVCANNCREALLREGLGTKISPEAYTWHFAAAWTHMPELSKSHKGNLAAAFSRSHDVLSAAVALPISINTNDDLPLRVRKALTAGLC